MEAAAFGGTVAVLMAIRFVMGQLVNSVPSRVVCEVVILTLEKTMVN